MSPTDLPGLDQYLWAFAEGNAVTILTVVGILKVIADHTDWKWMDKLAAIGNGIANLLPQRGAKTNEKDNRFTGTDTPADRLQSKLDGKKENMPVQSR